MTKPYMPRKLRTVEDHDRFRMALIAPDQAFFASETRWGVGRLERLVSLATLQAYRRGWDAYRQALDDCDGEALEQVGPKMIAALRYMNDEATAAGHQPLAPDTWEAPMIDGTVLVVVRTNAEASAVLRGAKAATGRPGLGMTATVDAAPVSTETPLPPDLAVTIRQQHDGRRLEVWSLAEIARLIEAHGSLIERKPATGKQWQGDATYSGRQGDEGDAADLVRSGYPLDAPLVSEARSTPALAF